jgi:hypothetical protein
LRTCQAAVEANLFISASYSVLMHLTPGPSS